MNNTVIKQVKMPLLTFLLFCKKTIISQHVSLLCNFEYHQCVYLIQISDLIAMYEIIVNIYGEYGTQHDIHFLAMPVAENRFMLFGDFEIVFK